VNEQIEGRRLVSMETGAIYCATSHLSTVNTYPSGASIPPTAITQFLSLFSPPLLPLSASSPGSHGKISMLVGEF